MTIHQIQGSFHQWVRIKDLQCPSTSRKDWCVILSHKWDISGAHCWSIGIQQIISPSVGKNKVCIGVQQPIWLHKSQTSSRWNWLQHKIVHAFWACVAALPRACSTDMRHQSNNFHLKSINIVFFQAKSIHWIILLHINSSLTEEIYCKNFFGKSWSTCLRHRIMNISHWSNYSVSQYQQWSARGYHDDPSVNCDVNRVSLTGSVTCIWISLNKLFNFENSLFNYIRCHTLGGKVFLRVFIQISQWWHYFLIPGCK
jgi:hypothetical protein